MGFHLRYLWINQPIASFKLHCGVENQHRQFGDIQILSQHPARHGGNPHNLSPIVVFLDNRVGVKPSCLRTL